MGKVILGEYFFKGDGSTQYSFTFPRGGLAATFVLQVLQKVGTTPNLAVAIEHKNHDDTTWASAGSFSAITAVGVYTVDITLIKEVVRLTYTITATTPLEGYLLDLLSPAWRPYI